MQRPLLYLSHYLRRHRSQYYDRLNAVRFEGDWEGWLKFFLRGVGEVSHRAAQLARSIYNLLEIDKQRLINSARGLRLLDVLSLYPVITATEVCRKLAVSPSTASRLLSQFTTLGILQEVTGFARNRKFIYAKYIAIDSSNYFGR